MIQQTNIPVSGPLTTIPETIAKWADRTPDKIAIFTIDRDPVRYGELVGQAQIIRDVLEANGITPRQRVALAIDDKPSMVFCFLGTLFHCATAVPVDPSGTTGEIKSYLTDVKASVLLTDAKPNSPAIQAAETLGLKTIAVTPETGGTGVGADAPVAPVPSPQRWPDPSDIAYIMSTSGTTGRKMVPRRHDEVIWNFQRKSRTIIKNGDQDICINPMPLFFNHGLHGGLLSALLGGGGVVLCSTTDLAEFFECLDRFNPTWMLAGKTFVHAIVSKAPGYDAIIRNSRLSFVHSGGTAFEKKTVADFEALFDTRLVECYAMTEVSTIACPPLPPTKMKPGTAGVPVVAEINILDEDGVAVARGDVGEIVVRDPGVIKGYYENPQADADTFKDGWFSTGDLGSLDPDGFLTLRGRKKDIISRGGEKISPLEIEAALIENPDVQQACVFGLPHPTLTEIVGAAVVPVPGKTIDKSEIKGFLRERLSPSKVPVAWIFVEDLPKTGTGKTRRNELIDLFQQSRRVR